MTEWVSEKYWEKLHIIIPLGFPLQDALVCPWSWYHNKLQIEITNYLLLYSGCIAVFQMNAWSTVKQKQRTWLVGTYPVILITEHTLKKTIGSFMKGWERDKSSVACSIKDTHLTHLWVILHNLGEFLFKYLFIVVEKACLFEAFLSKLWNSPV